MYRSKLILALVVIFVAITFRACGDSDRVSDDIEYTSQDKPDLIALPLLCPFTPDEWGGTNVYPVDVIAIGTQIYDVPTLFDRDKNRPLGDREAILTQVAAALLNLEAGDHPTDEVLTALGALEDWIVSTEISQEESEPEPAPEGPSDILRAYFDQLRPCDDDIHPLAEESGTRFDPRLGVSYDQLYP